MFHSIFNLVVLYCILILPKVVALAYERIEAIEACTDGVKQPKAFRIWVRALVSIIYLGSNGKAEKDHTDGSSPTISPKCYVKKKSKTNRRKMSNENGLGQYGEVVTHMDVAEFDFT